MKTTTRTVALGALAAMAAASPAIAGDWNNGAPVIRQMRGSEAVPVPVPRPIPVYRADWYLRADVGIGFVGSHDGSEKGLLFGRTDAPGTTGPEPLGSLPSWFNNDFDTFVTFGGGVGYRFSDRIRGDITVESTSMGHGVMEGGLSYNMHAVTVGPPDTYDPLPPGGQNQANVYIRDETKIHSTLMLVNAYYDFGAVRGFTPYVGAGLGVAAHRMKRKNTTTYTTCDSADCAGTLTADGESSDTNTSTRYALAAAATVGLSYDISDITTLDFNYRYLYIGGADTTLRVAHPDNTTSYSKVTVGEASEHQLRAGLRFNIN